MARRSVIKYPNSVPGWSGCPETCPDYCPYADCTMPPEIAAKKQDSICHGWIIGKDGDVVLETAAAVRELNKQRRLMKMLGLGG